MIVNGSSNNPPFKVGQPIRMVAHRAGQTKFRTGVVAKIRFRPSLGGDYWDLWIKRDGSKAKGYRRSSWSPDHQFWEAIPINDLAMDQTAQALADAVRRGDLMAALPLADRVFELCGGSKSPTIASEG